MNDTERVMTVGQAAHASGLSPKAVRLYERRGLLTPLERSHPGYRQFTDDDLARLSRVPWNFGSGPLLIRLR